MPLIENLSNDDEGSEYVAKKINVSLQTFRTHLIFQM